MTSHKLPTTILVSERLFRTHNHYIEFSFVLGTDVSLLSSRPANMVVVSRVVPLIGALSTATTAAILTARQFSASFTAVRLGDRVLLSSCYLLVTRGLD